MLFNDEMPLLAIVIVLAIFVAFMSVLMLLFMSLINKLLNCSAVHLLRVRFVRFGGSADWITQFLTKQIKFVQA
jgi:hypothetical protein